MNKKSLLAGILLGIAVVVSLGIVYIDTVQNFWSVSGGFVRLTVSNTVSTITLSTNAPHGFGYNTNNSTKSFNVRGRQPADTVTGNGTTAATSGGIDMTGGTGGRALTNGLTASGGNAGIFLMAGGVGGDAINTTSNSISGNGGAFNLNGGAGGGTASGTPGTSIIATNSVTGGQGGALNLVSGVGGGEAAQITTATQVLAGASGAITISTPNGSTPAVGVILRGGAGGAMTISAGNGGNSQNTNGAAGGALTITAGNGGGSANGTGASGLPGVVAITAGSAGAVTGGVGNTQPGALVSITAGNGSTGTTNSDGGHVFIAGGAPGSGAVPGNVVVGRTSAGTSRGGLQVGPIVTGTTATLTNLLTITATLDFPSIVAGAVADLNVAFAGAADGDVVTLGVPLSSVTNCTWMAFASNAVVYVRAANGQLVTAQDPNSGTFRIKLEKYQ